jgi:plasmid stability protein
MSAITIQLPTDTETKLRQKAAASGKSLESYLQDLAQRDAREDSDSAALSDGESISLAEFELLLDELSRNEPPLPALPAEFSRSDIYGDHD